MHIEINQSLQKIAANRTLKYLSEEIDWVINKMQERFVQSKLEPKRGGGFSIDQMDIDAIRPLLVSRKKIPAFIDTASRYKCFLPPDYAYLISDASYASEICKETVKVQNVKFYITWLKQVTTNKPQAPFYETLELKAGADTLTIPSKLPYYHTYTGYKTKEDIMFLIPWITNYFQSLGTFATGYETYGDLYKSAHYYFVSPTAQPVVTLKMDNIANNVTVPEVKEYTQHTSLNTEKRVANRLESSENIDHLSSTAFFKSSFKSPISELSKNILYVYYDSSFIVNSCEITYIRKPRIVSLFLGSDCELAPEFHQTICDLATEYIKGRLENGPGQQLAERDIESRVIL